MNDEKVKLDMSTNYSYRDATNDVEWGAACVT